MVSLKVVIAATTLCLILGMNLPVLGRDRAARAEFMKTHPCPSTDKTHGACSGWVVDHVVPLACGGDDHWTNMIWQTVEDAKAKDKIERKSCGEPIASEPPPHIDWIQLPPRESVTR